MIVNPLSGNENKKADAAPSLIKPASINQEITLNNDLGALKLFPEV